MHTGQSNDEFTPVLLELRDGRRVTVRAVRPGDRDNMQNALRALSTESRYARFMSPLRELTPKMLDRAVHPDENRELQLVAVTGEGASEQVVAGARYSGDPGGRNCEFATTVVDGWRRLGLARRLLEMLMEAACARGFAQMEGYILASNTGMLHLAKRLGFTEVESEEGPSVQLVRYELAKSARTKP